MKNSKKYEKFISHSKRIIRNAKKTVPSIPSLQGIFHKDGSVVVTDGHRANMAKNITEKEGVFDVNGEKMDVNYPNNVFDFFIKNELCNISILNVQKTLNAIKELKEEANKIDPYFMLLFENNEIKAFVDKKDIVSKNICIDFSGKIYCSYKYFYDILMFFKAMNIKEVELSYMNNRHYPMFFSDKDQEVQSILMPIKVKN